MALAAYLAATQSLLQNPPAPASLYTPANLTTYINTARGQLAAESECVRVLGSLTLSPGVTAYAFSAIASLPAGVSGVFSVRQVNVGIGGGSVPMYSRSWPWFQFYCLGAVVPLTGIPTTWAQLQTGVTGNLYVNPVPNGAYQLSLDVVGQPVALIDDTTPEAIPPLFTDAVPYYAAYLALLSSQRSSDAQVMFAEYQKFLQRARTGATPGVLSTNYNQVPDPTIGNKLGTTGATAGGGA